MRNGVIVKQINRNLILGRKFWLDANNAANIMEKKSLEQKSNQHYIIAERLKKEANA